MPELAVRGRPAADAEEPKELTESAVWGRDPAFPLPFHGHPASEAAEAAAVLWEAMLEALFGRLPADELSVLSAALSAVAGLSAALSAVAGLERAILLPHRLAAASLPQT